MNEETQQLRAKAERTPVEWMNAAVNALYAELTQSVADDVKKRWNAAREYLEALSLSPSNSPTEAKWVKAATLSVYWHELLILLWHQKGERFVFKSGCISLNEVEPFKEEVFTALAKYGIWADTVFIKEDYFHSSVFNRAENKYKKSIDCTIDMLRNCRKYNVQVRIKEPLIECELLRKMTPPLYDWLLKCQQASPQVETPATEDKEEIQTAKDIINRQQVEIERLKEENRLLSNTVDALHHSMVGAEQRGYSKALQELEQLKNSTDPGKVSEEDIESMARRVAQDLNDKREVTMGFANPIYYEGVKDGYKAALTPKKDLG